MKIKITYKNEEYMQCWSFFWYFINLYEYSNNDFSFHCIGDECSICKEIFVAADIKSNLKCAHGLYSVVLRSLPKKTPNKLSIELRHIIHLTQFIFLS